ncbi:MAG: class I SAM-dependent methyltransferase [Solirubrobacteraceae bacterium]
MSAYDDEIWEAVPPDSGPPPAHLTRFVRALGEVGGALDLGCGDGRLTAELQAGELTAADVSEVALDRARPRLAGARLVALEPDTPLPFGDGAFELVLCAETLEHVRDTQLLLSEARRVLAPSGRLAVTTPAHGRATGLRAAALGFESVFDPLSPHLRFYSRRSLVRLLGAMGFAVKTVQRRAGTLLCVATR